MKKTIGLILVLALALSALSLQGFAAFQSSVLDAPGYELSENGFVYREKALQEAGAQMLFYGEYNSTAPGAQYEWVIHSVRNGSETTLSTVMDIARDFEAKTGRKVIYATNGDYFLANGSNVESYVNDGIVVSKGSFSTKHCIGFDNRGKVTVGRMTETEKRLVVTVGGEKHFFRIDRINQAPQENEIAIYTEPGGHTVEDAGYYICASSSANLDQYPVYGTSRRMTQGSVQGGGSFQLKSGQFAVVVRGENAQFFYDNVFYEVPVDLVEIPAGAYAGCTWVLGGYDILVDGGTVGSSFHSDNGGNVPAPRTLIGFRADGTGFVCCVDGRQGAYSVGITVSKEAELAKALGAQYALELDGGGSTTVIVRMGDQLTLRNKPSDGSMRRVSNAIMLVQKAQEPVVTPPVDPTIPTEPEPTQPQPTEPAPTEAEPIPTDSIPTEPVPTESVQPSEPSQSNRPASEPAGDPPQPGPAPALDWGIAGAAVAVLALVLVIIHVKKKREVKE